MQQGWWLMAEYKGGRPYSKPRQIASGYVFNGNTVVNEWDEVGCY